MRSLVVCLTVSLSLVNSPTARASLWFVFKPDSALPGEVVVGRTSGDGSMRGLPEGETVPLFFVPPEDVDRVVNQSDQRLIQVGTAINRAGNGRVRFQVPDVRAGMYSVLAYCRQCKEQSGGRTLLPAGSFEVLDAPERHEETRGIQLPAWLLLPLTAAALLASGVVLAGRRSRPARGAAKRQL